MKSEKNLWFSLSSFKSSGKAMNAALSIQRTQLPQYSEESEECFKFPDQQMI